MIQEKAKICKIPAKIHQKYSKLCKNKPFIAYKTLVLLIKKTVKIDVSTYESVQCGGVPGRVLSGFGVF